MEVLIVVPEGGIRRQRQGGFQVLFPLASSSGAMQDGVFKDFGVRTAAGTRGVGVFRPPGGVGIETAGVCVVVGGGVEGVPFTDHEESGTYLQGLVGACHKEGGGDILAGQGRYLQHQGEAGEAFAQWECKVGKCVNRKVFAHRGRGDWGAPVQWEII